MTNRIVMAMAVLLLLAPAAAQDRAADETSLRQAVLDYIEGWYTGDVARVEKVLHPEFVRRIAGVTTSDEDFYIGDDHDGFIDKTGRGGDAATPEDKRDIEIRILDRARTTAVVRVDSAYYTEYLNLVRMRGLWKVVNVLWENVPNDRVAVPVASEILARHIGTYRHADGWEVAILTEGERLFLKPTWEPRSEYFPASETEFFTKTFKSGMTFERDGDGKTVALVMHHRFRDYRLPRVGD